MTEYERSLIFIVAGGVPENFPLIHQIHTNFKRGTQMLEVCRREGLIGKTFKQLWQDKGGSKMEVGSYLLKRLHQTNQRKLSFQDLK